MFARMTITQMKTDKVNEGIRLYQESVVATVKKQKGFRGVYLLSNFESGKGVSISIWDSEEDAIANEKSGYYQEQVAKFKDIFAAPPIREGYEVTVSERADT